MTALEHTRLELAGKSYCELVVLMLWSEEYEICSARAG